MTSNRRKGPLPYGPYIRMMKISMGMNSRELAKETGVSLAHQTRIERGESDPPMRHIKASAAVLDQDLDVLLGAAGRVRVEHGQAIELCPNATVSNFQLLTNLSLRERTLIDNKLADIRKEHGVKVGHPLTDKQCTAIMKGFVKAFEEVLQTQPHDQKG